MKILLFSPIRKNIEVLKVAIPSWLALNQKGIDLFFVFFDDNDDSSSTDYLKSFENDRIEVINFETIQRDNFEGDHNWNLQQIDRIAEIKNYALHRTVKDQFDAVFFVDADLVLHPETLISLVNSKKEFIFEIFWTDFKNDGNQRPNCWDFHSWNYDNANSILKLKEKGIFEVGAGGACTLINKKLIRKGLSFDRIPNMRFNGEDRHISSRVYALGSKVFIDTHYPAYHIFNFDQVDEAREWYSNGARSVFFDKWLNNQWKNKVIKSFTKKKDFWSRVRYFQYEVRRAIIKNFKKNFR